MVKLNFAALFVAAFVSALSLGAPCTQDDAIKTAIKAASAIDEINKGIDSKDMKQIKLVLRKPVDRAQWCGTVQVLGAKTEGQVVTVCMTANDCQVTRLLVTDKFD